MTDTILLDMGYDLGSVDTNGNAALLLDRDKGTMYIGAVDQVREFCRRFDDAPEWGEKLPADPEKVMELFERMDHEGDQFGNDPEEEGSP